MNGMQFIRDGAYTVYFSPNEPPLGLHHRVTENGTELVAVTGRSERRVW